MLFINKVQLTVGQFIRREKPLSDEERELIIWISNHPCFEYYVDDLAKKVHEGKITRDEALKELYSVKNNLKGGK